MPSFMTAIPLLLYAILFILAVLAVPVMWHLLIFLRNANRRK